MITRSYALRRVLPAAAVLVVVVGAALAFFSDGRDDGPKIAACRAAEETVERLKPLAKGDVAAITFPRPSLPPEAEFQGSSGEPLSLESFKGRTVLVNLWATWCVPCREEMPALNALQKEFGGPEFEVVAINVDTRQLDKPRQWLAEHKIDDLAYYADPTGRLLQVLQKSGHLVGLPTTFMLDPNACEVALLKGPADWSGKDATAFTRAALGRG
jgi:thiol-disulfide isomerase/thioredoxin